MPDLKGVRTSLEIGFASGGLPEKFLRYRGRATRSIEACAEFPYEDKQFQVVMFSPSSFSEEIVRESHRVLRDEGWLIFEISENDLVQKGYKGISDVFAIVKDGFNIIEVERSSWWRRWRGDGTVVIAAEKKRWRKAKVFQRRYV